MSLMLLILLGLLLAGIAVLIFFKIKGKNIPTTIIVLLGFMTICFTGVYSFLNKTEDYNAYQRLQWQPLNPEQIAPLVEQGYIVFVDIYADWCLPCRANKANVTRREKVVDVLDADNIILMKGNWTEPNPMIENYVGNQGGIGTPFNKVYGPSHPKGIILPVELTINAVFQALDAAK
ncbi:thioredoxin family protein [Shewanella olleyana]|uniref:thioredoxin family protein n=1 Tax=Shewanella olleyana TaxID=135626 RepID=UPI00200D78EE|nr:thioredoxin family protein [Shewanella olleyana]MCL1067137.1 thioredoxin family protein [Shewanella olleyana]